MEWDIFISYASEDRVSIVEPLANELKNVGLKVWYDQFELKLGDSLHEKIEEGLSKSRYGVVVLSNYFFQKKWPKQELNGLVAKEQNGVKIILPLWHNITEEEVREYSPILADRKAANTSGGIRKVIIEILNVAKPSSTNTDLYSNNSIVAVVQIFTHELVVNGRLVSNDLYAYINNGRTYFPARYLAYITNADTVWDESTCQLTFAVKNRVVSFKVNDTIMQVNGQKVLMDVPTIFADDRVMININYFAQAFGLTVTLTPRGAIILTNY